jgi:hypothetical protein
MILRYFRWNRKRDLKCRGTRRRIEQSLPPHPTLSPGERESVRPLCQCSGNVGFDPTHRSSAPRRPDQHLHDRTPWPAQSFQTSRVVLPLPWGEGWGEGEGITLSFTAFFSLAGSGSHSTENSNEPLFPDQDHCAVAGPGLDGAPGVEQFARFAFEETDSNAVETSWSARA